MSINITEEFGVDLNEYEKVPIAFRVESRFLIVPIDNGLRGLTIIEEPVEPYIKDYDAFESERPSRWSRRFNLSSWGFVSAFDNGRRVGGAAIAWKTSGVNMLEGRDDLACLWDLRIHPDYRNQGIGHQLFERAAVWARTRQCSQLKIETQNINVLACRFYARQNCRLDGINYYAYGAELNEIQMLWYLDLNL